MEEGTRPRWHSAVDLASVCGFAALWLLVCARLGRVHDAATGSALALAALPLGYVLADGVSGVVHWAADRFFGPRTPILGPLLVRPFREHHHDPGAMAHHGFLEVSGNSCLVSIPLLGTLASLPAPASIGLAFLQAILLSLTIGVFGTNLFHKWAHTANVARPVAWLQRHGWILRPEHHAVHHGGDHDRAFCITTGWLNPLLDRWRFFWQLERLLGANATTR
ncbi:MAG: kua-ubiquitin conjugating enzyme hybrid localization domain protein [Proteobacteria bacterium]|nr:kua-ubiquitin conjugating enzyme hybrid localization domain protein [Pseudomonadota bacterium]